MVLDWKNNKEEALKNGVAIKGTVYSAPKVLMTSPDGEICDCVFLNFPTLTFESDIEISNCTFKNCKELCFEDTLVKNCTFEQVEEITFVDTKVKKCVFKDITGDENDVITVQDSTISQCTFENIMLYEDIYLCEGYGSPWVENCVFKNIRTSRDDYEIFHMEEIEGKIFKRKKNYCFVDDDSCRGLDLISDLVDNSI